MIPELFSFGPIHLHSYGLLVAIGVASAIYFVKRNAQIQGLKPDLVIDIATVVVLVSFLAARLFYVALYFEYFLKAPLEIFMIWKGGLVLYGGWLGGLLTFYLFALSKQISFLRLLDLFVPAIAVAQGFGRVGCFLNGCCYGTETELPWGIKYAFLAAKVHPTQLYESLFCFALAGFLFWITSKQPKPGVISGFHFLFYGVGRFFLEFIRGDQSRSFFNLTLPQVMSIFIVTSGIILLLKAYYGYGSRSKLLHRSA